MVLRVERGNHHDLHLQIFLDSYTVLLIEYVLGICYNVSFRYTVK